MSYPSVAICSIVKKEAPYIAEWVKFNYLQGISFFYLYHNAETGEDDETKEAILKLSNDFAIQYIPWPGKSTFEKSIQLAAYRDCLRHLRDNQVVKFDWVACIDCDEFLYSPKAITVPQILAAYPETTGAVLVHWDLYGSNGHLHHSPELVTERFTKKAKCLDQHVKTIIRPKAYLSTSKNVHRLLLKDGFNTQTNPDTFIEHDSPWIHGSMPELRDGSYLTLAHYHTKSREEYQARCARGRADYPIPKNFEENFIVHDLNDVEDTFIRDTWSNAIKGL